MEGWIDAKHPARKDRHSGRQEVNRTFGDVFSNTINVPPQQKSNRAKLHN